MSAAANPARGEASLTILGHVLTLRPTFAALSAAEQELGSLYELVARAVENRIRLDEVVALVWHCIASLPAGMTREQVADALVDQGLAALAPVLKQLLGQILKGR